MDQALVSFDIYICLRSLSLCYLSVHNVFNTPETEGDIKITYSLNLFKWNICLGMNAEWYFKTAGHLAAKSSTISDPLSRVAMNGCVNVYIALWMESFVLARCLCLCLAFYFRTFIVCDTKSLS